MHTNPSITSGGSGKNAGNTINSGAGKSATHDKGHAGSSGNAKIISPPGANSGSGGRPGAHGITGAAGGGRPNLTSAGATARHTHHSANYWSNQSYFFGKSSPFGTHSQFHHNHNHHHHYIGYPSYGWGFGIGIGLGYGYGYPYGYRWGYPFGGYWSNPWTTWNGGFPCYSYNAVSPWYGYNALNFGPVNDPTVVLMPADGSLPPEVADDMPADDTKDPDVDGLDYAAIGEREFTSGDYARAVKSFRHAMVEDPGNGACALLLAQGLFQTGAFEEAAGAIQLATQILPEDKWGIVGEHRRDLYGSNADYVKQLRLLENTIREKKDSPALRFLLGWHYGYNGYPKEGVDQLNKVTALAPRDEIAARVRDVMQKRLDESDK